MNQMASSGLLWVKSLHHRQQITVRSNAGQRLSPSAAGQCWRAISLRGRIKKDKFVCWQRPDGENLLMIWRQWTKRDKQVYQSMFNVLWCWWGLLGIYCPINWMNTTFDIYMMSNYSEPSIFLFVCFPHTIESLIIIPFIRYYSLFRVNSLL